MKFFNKILKLEKDFVEKILKKNLYLKIVSLAIALTLFLLLNGIGSLSIGRMFDTTEYIDDIKLEVRDDDNKIISGLPKTIGVNVTGTEANVTKFKANSSTVTAAIDLTGREDGEYKVESSEISFSNNFGVDITPVIKSYVVNIDTLTQVVLPLEVEYISSKDEQPLVLDEPKLEQSNIKIDIGMNNKEKISSAKVMLDLSKIETVSKSGEYEFNERVIVYDKEGQVLDTHTELPTVKVVQSYTVNTVLLPVDYQVINNGTQKYVSYICKENAVVSSGNCSDEVKVYGTKDSLDSLASIQYVVDLENYNGSDATIPVYPLLPKGVYIEGDDQYEANIKLEEGKTKVLKDIPIVVQGLSNNLEVNNMGTSTVNCTITGAESIIDDFDENDVTIYIDASDVTKASTNEITIETNIDNTITYELSEESLEVEFKEKE